MVVEKQLLVEMQTADGEPALILATRGGKVKLCVSVGTFVKADDTLLVIKSEPGT